MSVNICDETCIWILRLGFWEIESSDCVEPCGCIDEVNVTGLTFINPQDGSSVTPIDLNDYKTKLAAGTIKAQVTPGLFRARAQALFDSLPSGSVGKMLVGTAITNIDSGATPVEMPCLERTSPSGPGPGDPDDPGSTGS